MPVSRLPTGIFKCQISQISGCGAGIELKPYKNKIYFLKSHITTEIKSSRKTKTV